MAPVPISPIKPGRFSVVVPSYQQAEFLERTLRSLVRQDWPDVEILVQDGGSRDRSVEILKGFGDRLQWQSRQDGGQSAAINEGLRKATGEYLGYLCSDDVLFDGALRRVGEYFAAHPDALVVYGLADFIDERDEVLGRYPVEPWNYERLKETCFICQPACFWRREVVERFGLFDESLRHAMDYEYWLRVGATIPFHFLKEPLAASRYHARAKSFEEPSEALRVTLSVLERYHGGRIPPRWIVAYARDRAEWQLRKGGAGRLGRARFAVAYWSHLFRMARRVTKGGGGLLRQKMAPPYRSALRRIEDPIAYWKSDLAAASLPVG